MWKNRDLLTDELINVEQIAANSDHILFLVDEAGIHKIEDSKFHSIQVKQFTTRVRSNITVSGHDIFFIGFDEEIGMIDTEAQTCTSLDTCSSEQSYLILDELNRLYTFQDSNILRLDDYKLFPVEQSLKHGFVVHQNIIYAPISKNIFKYDLESQKLEEMHILFDEEQQFQSLNCIIVDHKQHKLYVIDHKQKSIFQVTLSDPHEATLIFKSNNRTKREGPSGIAAVDGIVYVLDCVFFGTENFYMIRKLTERIGWKVQRLLWIAVMKCDASECKMAMLPRDIIKLIIQVIQA